MPAEAGAVPAVLDDAEARCSSRRSELRGPVLPTLYAEGLPWNWSYICDGGITPGVGAGAVPAIAGAVPE